MQTYQGMSNMLRHDRWMVSALIIAGVTSSATMGGRTTLAEEPATLEEISGSDLKRVVLTKKAAERLAIAHRSGSRGAGAALDGGGR